MKILKRIILLGCLATFAMQMSVSAQLLDRTEEEIVFKLPTMRSSDSTLNIVRSKKIQKQKEFELELISKTVPNSECLFIGNTYYTISRSLVGSFKGYKTVFDPYALNADQVYDNMKYGDIKYEKPYRLTWELIDDELFLTSVFIITFNRELSKEKLEIPTYDTRDLYKEFGILGIFEKFIGRKFAKLSEMGFEKREHPFFTDIMKADWVNGVYLLREWGEWKFTDKEDVYPNAIYPHSVVMIEFKNGVVVSSKVLDSSKY